MDLNENKIRLSGVANIPSGLTNGKSYDLTLKDVEVRKVEEVPNDDGTYDKIFSLKISELSEINIIDERTIITAKKKPSKQSVVLRMVLEEKARNLGLDTEEYYKKRMSEIIDNEK